MRRVEINMHVICVGLLDVVLWRICEALDVASCVDRRHQHIPSLSLYISLPLSPFLFAVINKCTEGFRLASQHPKSSQAHTRKHIRPFCRYKIPQTSNAWAPRKRRREFTGLRALKCVHHNYTCFNAMLRRRSL